MVRKTPKKRHKRGIIACIYGLVSIRCCQECGAAYDVSEPSFPKAFLLLAKKSVLVDDNCLKKNRIKKPGMERWNSMMAIAERHSPSTPIALNQVQAKGCHMNTHTIAY